MTSRWTSPYSETEMSPSCRTLMSGSCSASCASATRSGPASSWSRGSTTASSRGGRTLLCRSPVEHRKRRHLLLERGAEADAVARPERPGEHPDVGDLLAGLPALDLEDGR